MKNMSRPRNCSVERSLNILGDRWIFLILREAFFRVRHFDQFQENLGIATNILSHRLKVLVENDIMEKQRDKDDARRITYRLTEKGLDIYPIVLALMRWGDRWLNREQDPPLALFHKTCQHTLTPVICCDHCGQPVRARDVSHDEEIK